MTTGTVPPLSEPLVLEWSWRYFVLHVIEHESVLAACRSAEYKSDEGSASLAFIEVIEANGSSRQVSSETCWELMQPEREKADAAYRDAPKAVARIDVSNPDGDKDATLGWYNTLPEAEADLSRLSAFLGDRVRIEAVK